MKNLSQTETEIQEYLQKIHDEMMDVREKSWLQFKPELDAILNTLHLPSPIKENYVTFLRVVWLRGYASGSTNLSAKFAQEMGFGDIFEKITKKPTVKPENN